MLKPIGGRSEITPKGGVGAIGAISAQEHVENPLKFPSLNRGIG
jgi:hypothetical protein